MNRVFISYSRKDEQFARRIATSLSDAGLDVWIDVDDIPSGMKWSTAIQEGLLTSQALMVIISPDSMASRNVEDEWQYFLDKGKLVLPIMWRPAEMHFQLNRIQYINFYTQPYNVALMRLFDELKRCGMTVKLPPYLQPTKTKAKKTQPTPNEMPTQHSIPRRERSLPMPPTTTPVQVFRPTEPTRPKRWGMTRWHWLAILLFCLIAAGFAYSVMHTQDVSAVPDVVSSVEAQVVANTSTNVRQRPSPDSPRIGALLKDQSAVILGTDKARAWWYIRLDYENGGHAYGWVSAAVVQEVGNLELVEMVMP